MPPQSRRNEKVETAVRKALDRVDAYVSGEAVVLPKPEHRRACDTLLENQAASVRTATLFLMFYWLEEPTWDRDEVPIGVRGEYGDKLLCEELTQRNITLHGPIVAYAENLGWKGNVAAKNLHLLKDTRFNGFLNAVADAAGHPDLVKKIADYMAQRFAESKTEPKPLPPVGPEVLTFVRAKQLFHTLLGVKTEGYIQQFMIAALLYEYRRRHTIEIKTHRPHAADRYDETAGDIEEWHEGRLIRAYEVTVRDDWQNRISGFKTKMGKYGLSKYIIIAANINTHVEWSVPAKMALKLEPFGQDIAIVDITDVINFLCAELTPTELRGAVNQAYVYLSDRKLSGKAEFKDAYLEAVRGWLDVATVEVQEHGTPAKRKT